jgi:hypothetical protein
MAEGPAEAYGSACRVVVELAEWVTDDDLRLDLERNPQHQLHDHQPDVTRHPDGRTELSLVVDGSDVWTCTLFAMALLRQSGYEARALQVRSLAPAIAA